MVWTSLFFLLASSCICATTHEADDLYSHLYSNYLQHSLPASTNSVTNKREIKKHEQSGLFYHEGPYVSHPQSERAARPLEVESYVTTDSVTRRNPYTYSVTGGSITPSSLGVNVYYKLIL